jgi:hypothetical protein
MTPVIKYKNAEGGFVVVCPVCEPEHWRIFHAWFDGAGHKCILRSVINVKQETLQRFKDFFCRRGWIVEESEFDAETIMNNFLLRG